MKNTPKQTPGLSRRTNRFLFAAALVAFCAPSAVAQQWTGPDGNNNISNANSGNVGVGTTAPQYKLDLANSVDKAQMRFGLGALDSGGFLFSNAPSHAVFSGGASWNGGWVAKAMSASLFQSNNGAITIFGNTGLTPGNVFTPTARLSINPSGYVGVGTASPAGPLDVRDTSGRQIFWNDGINGHSLFSASGNAIVSANLYYTGSAWNRFNTGAAGGMWWAGNDGTLQVLQAAAGSNPVSAFTSPLFIKANGYIGFGTTNPAQRFHVLESGNNTFAAQIEQTNGTASNGLFIKTQTAAAGDSALHVTSNNGAINVLTARNNGYVGIGTASPTKALDVTGEIRSTGGIRFADGTLQTTAGGGSSQWANNGSGINYSAGNVAIGTSTPAALFDVRNADGNFYAGFGYGANKETYLRAGNSTNGIMHIGDVNTSKTVLQENGGNVGIGTQAPAFSLDVQSPSPWAARFKKTDATHGGILVESAAGYNPNIGLSVNGSIKWYLNNNVSQSDSLQFWESTGANARFTLTQAGNVGIGTTNPAEKLEINGNLKLSGTGNLNATGTIEAGNIKAKYQDLAEWVPSSEELSAGTVVVLDTTKSNQVISSSTSYDTRVAGVISAQPGITLGEGGEGKVLVATTGRVRVKVDASRGAIQIGDLLVTSDVAGVAMKSEAVNLGGVQIHRPGTIIGKALEPLANGKGEILVLLSLQ